MPINIQLRRGNSSQLASNNPVLTPGELVVETDTRNIKVGDGVTPWNSLEYAGAEGPAGINGSSASTTGALAYLTTSTPPAGWLPADGDFVLAESYPSLSDLLSSTFNGLSTPASVTVPGYAKWVPNVSIFNPDVSDGSFFGTGEYLSDDYPSGQVFTAFNFSLSQPAVLTAVTILNIGLGAPPSYWKIMSDTDTIAETAANSSFGSIGGTTSYNNEVTPNWYTFNNSLSRQNYTLLVAHSAGYFTDLGITRILFQQLIEAPAGFIIAPAISTLVTGTQTLYPYIKI